MGAEDDDEAELREERLRAHFDRHKMLFVLGIVPPFLGVLASRASSVVAALLLLCGSACWVASGVAAVRARRHMFSAVASGRGRLVVRPSEEGDVGPAVACAGLCLLALGLAFGAVKVLQLG